MLHFFSNSFLLRLNKLFDSIFDIIKQKYKTSSEMGLSYSKPSSKREFKKRLPKNTLAMAGELTLKNGQNLLEVLQSKKNNLDYTPTACTQTQPTVSRRSSKVEDCSNHIQFQQQVKSIIEGHRLDALPQKKEKKADQIKTSIYKKEIQIGIQKPSQTVTLAPITITNKAAPRFSIQSTTQKPNFSRTSEPIRLDSVRLSFNSHKNFASETDEEPISPKPTILSKTMTFSNKFAEMQRNIAQHDGHSTKLTKEVRRAIIGKRRQL